MKKESSSGFPKGFFWGASTSAHQVEGGLENQWSVWELAHATELARTAAERLDWLPEWERFRTRAEDPDNYVSGRGVEHYKRYKEDFAIIKQLNMNAFRFGIEWSRLEPEEGKWDEQEVEHYRRYIRILRKNDIESFATLWHWTMPTWFTEKGGFAKKENICYFERFVQKVSDDLADDLKYAITLNEPNVYVTLSYLMGEWPPQEKKPLSSLKVYWHLVLAHKRAYGVLKQDHPELQIGIAANLIRFQPKRPGHWVDRVMAWVTAYAWNWWFLRRIRGRQDFVGVNYYMNERIKGFKRRTPKKPANDLGWYMKPAGILPVLTETWRRFKRPIIITENGLADERDEHRRWWLEQTIVAMGKARKQGIDLRGYLHWSLLDNFEWKFGWWPKFGLIAVDRKHDMKRTARPSAKWLAAYIKKVRGLS